MGRSGPRRASRVLRTGSIGPVLVAFLVALSALTVAAHASSGREGSGTATPFGSVPGSGGGAFRASPLSGSGTPVHPASLTWVHQLAPSPLVDPSSPSVAGTLILSNQTLLPGNYTGGVATDPGGAVYDNRTGEIFVTNLNSNNVDVISDATDKVVAQIDVGGDPVGIALDYRTGEVFVSDHNWDTVSVISDATDSVVATIPVISGPEGLAYDSALDEVYVASWNLASYTGSVEAISGTSHSVVANISVGSYPSGVAYDSARSEIFVTNQNPGYSQGTVSVISDSSNSLVATIPVGEDPYGIVYDPALGELFVANSDSGNLSVISDASNTVTAAVEGVGDPDGVAFDDSSGMVFVTEPGTCYFSCSQGRVAVVSASTNSLDATVAVGAASLGLAYDSGVGTLFVPNQGGGCASIFGISLGCVGSSVSLVSGVSDAVIGTIYLSTSPVAVAYDSSTGELFVADDAFDEVLVLSATTGALVANIPLGSNPNGLAYDSGKGEVFVTEGLPFGSGNVSVISDTTNTVVAKIRLAAGSYPLGIAYDGGKGELFVADNNHDSVAVLSDTSNSWVANVTVDWYPTAVAYDGSRGEVFAASEGGCLYPWCSSVTVISDTTNTALATIPVGADPSGLAYDGATNEVYVATRFGEMNAISVDADRVVASVPSEYDTSAVAYDPSNGLLLAASTLNNTVGIFLGGINSPVATLPVGRGPVAIGVNPSDGTAYGVSSGAGTISILAPGTARYPEYHLVVFTETGLPNSRNWSVAFNGAAVTEPAGAAIAFAVTNGTYSYLVLGVGPFRVSGTAAAGTITVNGANVPEAVAFSRGPTVTLTFRSVGLAAGTRWCVMLGETRCSTTASVQFKHLGPGTYTYRIGSPAGMTSLAKVGGVWKVAANGSVSLARGATIHVRFAYAVTFTETGLPSGTSWSVTGQAETVSSTTSSVVLYMTNGTHGFLVHAVVGYVRSPARGMVTVAGDPTGRSIVFST
ncbi:MAG: YncE family protein [Thermoplasmata archaeon]